MIQTLNKLTPGTSAIIHELKSDGDIRQRLQDLGIIPGTVTECLYFSKWKDISAYLVRGSIIALRSEDAKRITIVPCGVML